MISKYNTRQGHMLGGLLCFAAINVTKALLLQIIGCYYLPVRLYCPHKMHEAQHDNAANAPGYSMYYYIENMYSSPAVRVLSVDGVAPSTETIASGAYPLRTTYCAVLRKDTPADHPARRLIAWLLGPEGQNVASSAGYAPLEPMGVE